MDSYSLAATGLLITTVVTLKDVRPIIGYKIALVFFFVSTLMLFSLLSSFNMQTIVISGQTFSLVVNSWVTHVLFFYSFLIIFISNLLLARK